MAIQTNNPTFSTNDKRGRDYLADKGNSTQAPKPACRVCGGPEVHTVEYSRPTMECVEYLRQQVANLEAENKRLLAVHL